MGNCCNIVIHGRRVAGVSTIVRKNKETRGRVTENVINGVHITPLKGIDGVLRTDRQCGQYDNKDNKSNLFHKPIYKLIKNNKRINE